MKKNAGWSAAMLLALAMGMSNNMPVAEEKCQKKETFNRKGERAYCKAVCKRTARIYN